MRTEYCDFPICENQILIPGKVPGFCKTALEKEWQKQ
jgi:hypothetical protein